VENKFSDGQFPSHLLIEWRENLKAIRPNGAGALLSIHRGLPIVFPANSGANLSKKTGSGPVKIQDLSL
jgi:hypothetical protein